MSSKVDLSKAAAEVARDLKQALNVLEGRGESSLPGQLESVLPPPAAAAATPEPVSSNIVLPPTDLGKEARIDHLGKQAQSCKRCRLAKGRQKVVFGVGSSRARLVLIGEGPGANEDRTGEPFVGRAGQLLNRMLAAIGLARDEVYITNIVKCRPPRNRDPEPDEISTCRPFLDAQLDTLRPDVLLALGRPAAQSLLNDKRALGQLRNKVHDLNGTPLIVTYHPAFLLRNPVRKASAWEDLQLLLDLLVRKGVAKPLPDPWWRRA